MSSGGEINQFTTVIKTVRFCNACWVIAKDGLLIGPYALPVRRVGADAVCDLGKAVKAITTFSHMYLWLLPELNGAKCEQQDQELVGKG